mmetsp:Transcript_3920/g.6150  ORF Transcript_3920/g.6150 Transcript_3920/m.6150 type:complete len:106 (-) Transcript_3920:727-1044(-)
MCTRLRQGPTTALPLLDVGSRLYRARGMGPAMWLENANAIQGSGVTDVQMLALGELVMHAPLMVTVWSLKTDRPTACATRGMGVRIALKSAPGVQQTRVTEMESV